MDNLILLILGLFISVLGITNIKGNISTIHSYNRRKVKEEDIPKYGKVVGTGTLIMGVSFILFSAFFCDVSLLHAQSASKSSAASAAQRQFRKILIFFKITSFCAGGLPYRQSQVKSKPSPCFLISPT